MQVTASHTGISAASARFSYFDVPTGKVPSGGIADTGRRSPSPAIIGRVTLHDERRAVWPTRVARRCRPGSGGTGCVGRADRHLVQAFQGRIDRREIGLDDLVPLRAVGFLRGSLDRGNRRLARQYAGQREEAGLKHGVDALAGAGGGGHARRRRSRTRAACSPGCGRGRSPAASPRSRRPGTDCSGGPSRRGAACASTSIRDSRPHWWQATNRARVRRGRRTGSAASPNRRCETVTEPDFFES